MGVLQLFIAGQLAAFALVPANICLAACFLLGLTLYLTWIVHIAFQTWQKCLFTAVTASLSSDNNIDLFVRRA